MQKTAIIGIGNILMGDDGVGVRVAEYMAKNRRELHIPKGAAIEQFGVYGMLMLGLFEQYDKLIFVDAVNNTGQPAGTIVEFEPQEAAAIVAFKGAHDTGLSECVAAAKLLGYVFDCICIGIQIDFLPSNNEPLIGLSPAVQNAVTTVAKHISDKINLW